MKRKPEATDSAGTPSSAEPVRLPNILITGTPGTGKTTTSEMLQIAVPGMRHVNVGALVKDKGLHYGWDDEWESWILDEDKLVDELEPILQRGGQIVDHHGCDFLPEELIELVVVLRTDNSILGKRLDDRGYSERKVTENIEAEIMQVVLEEAREAFPVEKILELESNSLHDMEENVARLRSWIGSWRTPKRTKAAERDSSGDDGGDDDV
ncbi:P-loop containing nucleoside triphosphate hydrolase protein [Hyaloraphidium curvatum]|nr:P-loop containing nucleoside triphosphate hydrolase protein [Hyaloraphidium curvatum]